MASAAVDREEPDTDESVGGKEDIELKGTFSYPVQLLKIWQRGCKELFCRQTTDTHYLHW